MYSVKGDHSYEGLSVNAKRALYQPLCAAAVLGLILTGCNNDPQVGEADKPIPASGELPEKDPKPREARVVRGFLRHSPQDVKSADAWLGQEFTVAETPIRATEEVPREELMKMVGKQVEVEGIWNEGTEWDPQKTSEEESQLQAPSFSNDVTIMRGSGIEATLVREIEQ